MHRLNTFRNFSICLVLAFCIMPGAAGQDYTSPQIPSSGKTIQSFVPKGFRLLAMREADFNGDGLRDAVIVITSDDDIHPDGLARPLLVLFRQTDGSYQLSARSDNAVIVDAGGEHGDPFPGIIVKGNTFVLSDGSNGGGDEGEDRHMQYRYQNGDWYLIGIVQNISSNPLDDSAKAIADYNKYMCPELHLSTDEVCNELDYSKNFNTHKEIMTWGIYSMKGYNYSTKAFDYPAKTWVKVLHRKLPAKPLVLLRDVDVNDGKLNEDGIPIDVHPKTQ